MGTGQKSRVSLGTPVAYMQYGAFADYKVNRSQIRAGA